MIKVTVGTTSLTEKQSDSRDYIVSNVLKLDKVEVPEAMMWWITETVYQSSFPSCTAASTTNSMICQNELEYKQKVELSWKDLRAKMWHSITKADSWDSVENAVKTALKMWITGVVNGKQQLFQSDAWAYGKWDIWQKALTIAPLITVIYGNNVTWNEMLWWEVKTISKKTTKSMWHAVMIAGYDKDWIYFYNSFGDKINKNGISNFKISWATFDKMIAVGMLNWRYFVLVDKKDLVDYAQNIEISKQIIKLSKQMYEIWDQEVKSYFIKIGLSDFLQKKYWFKYE